MRSQDELAQLWNEGPEPPRGSGTVRLIVVRKGDGVHHTVDGVNLSREEGVVGDRWAPDPTKPAKHGDCQVTLMNARVVELIADDQPLHLPGDNFHVDLDLSTEALPVGSRLKIGTAVIALTETPHTGCKKFAERFGTDALKWVNGKAQRHLRLRGILCRVVEEGEVQIGDRVEVLPA